MIGCVALCALAALVTWPQRLDGARALTVLALTAVASASILFADARPIAVLRWATVAIAVAIGRTLFVVSVEVRRGRWMLAILATSGTVAALHAIYQKLWGLDQIAAAIRDGMVLPNAEAILVRAEVGRSFASFPTPAALGGYLVLTSCVVFGAVPAANASRRALLVGIGLLQIVGIGCTESVTAVLGAAGALTLAFLTGRLPRRWALISLVIALLGVAGVMLGRGAEVLDLKSDDTPWALRAKNFRVATEMISDHPWRGVGLGAFGERYPAYRQQGDNESQHVHNLPLELSAELGLPLGLAGSAIFFLIFVGPIFRRSTERSASTIGVEIALCAFALQNLADFTAFLPSILWTAVLLRVAIAKRDALAWSWPSRLPAVAALLVVALAAYIVGADSYASGQADRSVQAAVEGDYIEAERLLDRAQDWAPWSADYAIGRAQLSLRDPDPVQLKAALAALDLAVRRAPHRASAYDLRGKVRASLGDYPGAWADAQQALKLYPMHTPYQRRLQAVERWLDGLGVAR
jgi:O-antigen ligase